MRKWRKTMWKLAFRTFQAFDTPPQHDLNPKTNPMARRRTLRHPKRGTPLPVHKQMKAEFRNWTRVRTK